MIIGTCKATLHIAGVRSLKEKRRILKSLLVRLQNHFKVAVAETDFQNNHQKAEIGIACISTKSSHASQILAAVVRFIEREGEIELVTYHTELL